MVSLSSVRSATSPMSLRPISFVGRSHFEPASDGSRSLLARRCRRRWPPATRIATRRLGACGLRHEGLVPTGSRVTVKRPLLRKTAYDVRVLRSMRSLAWRRPRCRSQKDRLLYTAILTSPRGTLESRSYLHRPWPRAACENQRNGELLMERSFVALLDGGEPPINLPARAARLDMLVARHRGPRFQTGGHLPETPLRTELPSTKFDGGSTIDRRRVSPLRVDRTNRTLDHIANVGGGPMRNG
jgi:hypothetical protein